MLFVFMSQPDFACNPHALWEYVKDNTNHETAWLVKRDKKYYELLRRGVRCAVYDTVEGNALLKEADYVIMNSYTFERLPKRANQIFVNLWHGSGIKAHDFYNHDMDPEYAKKLAKFFDKIDLMCVHSLDDRYICGPCCTNNFFFCSVLFTIFPLLLKVIASVALITVMLASYNDICSYNLSIVF